MTVETLVGGVEIARRYLPSAVRDADVVSVLAEPEWQDSAVRILRLDYQFMARRQSWIWKETRIWEGFVMVMRESGLVRLGSHGEYSKDQIMALTLKLGQFPPPALDLRHLELDLAAMENQLVTLLPTAPKAHTLALRQEEGQPVWSLAADKSGGEVVTVLWNAVTGDCIYSRTEGPRST